MMKKLFLFLFVLIGTAGFSQTTDLFISEYAEGSSNHKYLELYNGTGASINLADYELWRISNGGSWPESTVSLTGMLADGAVLVVANSQADTLITNLPNATTAFNAATYFNGDDAVGLAKNNGSGTFILIDAIGKSGPDPGSGWDVAGTTNATANHTMVRKSTQASPDTNWVTAAGTSIANSQWEVFPQNTWTYAGVHTFSQSSPTCNDPSALSATTMSASASLMWNMGSGNMMSDIEWGMNGFTQGSGTMITGFTQASGTLMLSSLAQGTSYDFYVRDYCTSTSSYSNWVGPYTFTTTILLPEPTNHVTMLSAIASITSVNLTWIDSDTSGGAQAPMGYLIVGAQGSTTLNMPVDMTPVADDSDWSDGLVAFNATHINDTNMHMFTGMLANTNYAFKVFPYSNMGTDIDYKTGGMVPSISTTTMTPPSCAPASGITSMYVSATEADIMWMSGSSTFNIEWGTAGFTQGSGTMITGFNQASGALNLSGLALGSSYDVYIQTDCGVLGTSVYVMYNFMHNSPPAIPIRNIDLLTNVTAGSLDSLGVYCKIQGIVTSIDFDGNTGYNIFVQDSTGGMYVYRSSDIGTFQATIGDEVRLVGEVVEYFGLTELVLDSATTLSTGNPRPTPAIVTTIGENTEGDLISMTGLYLANPSQWPATTSGSVNLDVVTPAGDTIIVRVDSDSHIFDSLTVAPGDTFSIVGNGTYSFGAYQIMPSLYTDFMVTGSASCAPSSGITAMYVDAVTADLGWTAGGASMWNIEWGMAGFTQGSGTMVNGVTTNPVSVTGLTVGMSYDFYIQDDCGSVGTSSYVGPYTYMHSTPFIPMYDIATVTTVDVNGEPDSLTVYCKLQGVVFTPDYDGNNGLSFYMQDATGGVNVFNFNDIDNYVVTKGDELRVVGEIAFYNGLTELLVDSITVLSSGNSIGSPMVTTVLDEGTDSEFIKIEKVKIVDATLWPAPGFNENLQVVNANLDTMIVRIDKDALIQDTLTAAPTGFLNITGVGGQFDGSAPYDGGYQIFPRYTADFETVDPCPAPTGLQVDTTSGFSGTISWTSSNPNAVFNVVWGEAGFILSQGYKLPGLTSNSFVLNGLTPSTSYEVYVQDSCGSFLGNSAYVGPVQFATAVGVSEVITNSPLTLYPNPSGNNVITLNKISSYVVYDLLGQEVVKASNVKTIDAKGFEAGIYLVKTEIGETIKLIIK